MTKIFIEGYELDLSQGLSNQITYAIDDLQNLDSKSTSFTKTIVLPGTANNNELFGNIFDFNNSNFSNDLGDNVLYNFNAARNAEARIEVNGLQIMKGVLRLLEIVKDGDAIEYECSIFGELGGFVNKLGNLRLEDLNFSAYNHTYNVTNISNSWDTLGASGYCYPLIDYGNVSTGQYGTLKKDFQFSALRPALFVREYLDKIITNAGYTYSSTFLDSTFFKQLVIPHNQKALSSSNSAQLKAYPLDQTYSGTAVELYLQFGTITLGNFTLTDSDTKFTYTGTTKIVNIDFNVNAEWAIGQNATMYLKKNGTSIASYNMGTGFSGNFFNVNFNLTNYTINVNDYFQVHITWSLGSQPYEFNSLTSSGFNFNTTTPEIVPVTYNETITINDTIPKGIFQKDFFTSILKMFNLLVTEDKFIPYRLNIEPYVDFWSGDVIDWSNKLDRSQPIKIKPMSEINARYYNLKYRQDSDFYNEDYRKKYNEGYGDRIFDNGLEFAKDSQSVEVIFASSVLYGLSGTDKVYPAIYKKSNENTKEDSMDHIIRIMQIKKLTGLTSWDIMNGATVLASKTSYLYGGHLDTPDAPNTDIGFGAPQQLYFTLASGNLSNNLFNTYYSPYLAEITNKDSRLLSGMFNLTSIDMYNLDFAKFIFIDGGVYRISKIIDYSPETNDLTKVELLRVINKTY